MSEYIYALRLPNGTIKFGITVYQIRERFLAARQRHGIGVKGLGIARGGSIHETELRRLLEPFRVEGEREIFHPEPLVMRVVSMMGPFPEMPLVSVRLRRKFEWAA